MGACDIKLNGPIVKMNFKKCNKIYKRNDVGMTLNGKTKTYRKRDTRRKSANLV